MIMILASSPLTSRTLSIHLERLANEFASKLILDDTGEIENDDGRTGILDVRWDQGMKSLLSCGIPQLHP